MDPIRIQLSADKRVIVSFIINYPKKEIEIYQQTLDRMPNQILSGKKPKIIFEPHVGSCHWQTQLGIFWHLKILDTVESVLDRNLVLILFHFIIKYMDEGKVKRLTGSDKLKVRFMRGDMFEFSPTQTFFVCIKNKPVVRNTDDGIWR